MPAHVRPLRNSEANFYTDKVSHIKGPDGGPDGVPHEEPNHALPDVVADSRVSDMRELNERKAKVQRRSV